MKIGVRTGVLIAGLLLGALLFAMTPVVAHHNDAKLKKRVTALTTKVKNLTTRVNALTEKTSNLHPTGDAYAGFVHARWIWAQESDGCSTDGQNAVWDYDVDNADDDFFHLACTNLPETPGPQPQPPMRP